MRLSSAHCSLLIVALTVFQPTTQKSLKSNCVHRPHAIRRTVHHTVSNRKASDDALLFPSDEPVGSADRSGSELAIPTPLPCPDGKDFCDTADDYPKELIKSMLKKQGKTILYVDEIPEVPETDRFAQVETAICESKSQIIFPNKARSAEGVFEFIVNDDEGNRQGIKVETCGTDGECNIPGTLSLGYTSRCKQQYIKRSLLVLDRDSSKGGGFISKPFEFPACCGCVISSSMDTQNRFALEYERQVNVTSTAKAPTSRPKNVKG